MPDRGALGQGLVGHPLERQDLASTVAAVGRDQADGLLVVDPVPQRLRREPAEHDRVDRADPRAGQHRDCRLRDHGQVDRHPVAAPDAQRLERVGASLDFAGQVPVGQHPAVAGLAFPDDGGLVAPWPLEVPVETVGRHIELAAHEPAGVRRGPFQRGGPGGHPVQLPGLSGPEAEAVGRRRSVEIGLGCRPGGEFGWWREPPLLGEQGVDLMAHVRSLNGVAIGPGCRFPISCRGVPADPPGSHPAANT